MKGAGSREARTHFEVIEALPADTLVHARLETGRTHQIRVHFAAIGHPVAGDPEYGSRGRHGLERQFLHASRLAFTHPRTGEELEFTSELPDDLRAALDRARNGTRLEEGRASESHAMHAANAAQHLQSRGLCTQPPPRGTGGCPGTPGFPQPRRGQAQRHNQAIGRSDGRGRHQGAAGGRSSLRSPDAALEPAHAPLHLRGAGGDPHHRSPPDGGAAQAGDRVRDRGRREGRRGPLRRDQEAGP